MRQNRTLADNVESASVSHQKTLAVQYRLGVAHRLREASWQQRLDEISARATSALRDRAVADAAPPTSAPMNEPSAADLVSVVDISARAAPASTASPMTTADPPPLPVERATRPGGPSLEDEESGAASPALAVHPAQPALSASLGSASVAAIAAQPAFRSEADAAAAPPRALALASSLDLDLDRRPA
jgi:hypothetical protein